MEQEGTTNPEYVFNSRLCVICLINLPQSKLLSSFSCGLGADMRLEKLS